MSYDNTKPSNDGFLANAPQELRTNQEGLRTGQIVDAGTVKGLTPGNAAGQIPISNGTQCVGLNAEKVGGNLPSAFAPVAHNHAVASSSSNGFMANTDKAKLDSVATGAEVNQNAFANVLVGGTTVQADSKTDTLEMIAGQNITITPDAANDKITIAVSGKVPSAASADNATSAGNATTVGGNLPSAFAPAVHDHRRMLPCKDYVGTGYIAETDKPSALVPNGGIRVDFMNSCSATAGWATAITCGGYNNYGCTQVVFPYNNGGYAKMWIRYSDYTNDSWSGWKQMATTDQIPTSLPANGGNASTINGLSTATDATANTLAVRDSHGYLQCSYLNSNRGNEDGTAAASYLFDSGDGWMRKKSLSAARSEIMATVAGQASSYSASTQPQFSQSVAGSAPRIDSTTGSGTVTQDFVVTRTGVPAGTYSLQGILQELVNRSHDHNYFYRVLSIANCNCSPC